LYSFDGDVAVLGDLEQPRLRPPLDDERVAVGQAPSRAEFLVRLGQGVAPHDLHVARHFLGHIVRGKKNVAVWQNGAVSRTFIHLPNDLALFVDELSQPAAN
jgi:nucleoside-diphosphate-sugar epimerase